MRSIILNGQPVQVAAPMVTRSRVPVVMWCASLSDYFLQLIHEALYIEVFQLV